MLLNILYFIILISGLLIKLCVSLREIGVIKKLLVLSDDWRIGDKQPYAIVFLLFILVLLIGGIQKTTGENAISVLTEHSTTLNGIDIRVIGESHVYSLADNRKAEEIIRGASKIFHEIGDSTISIAPQNYEENINQKNASYNSFIFFAGNLQRAMRFITCAPAHVITIARERNITVIGLESSASRANDIPWYFIVLPWLFIFFVVYCMWKILFRKSQFMKFFHNRNLNIFLGIPMIVLYAVLVPCVLLNTIQIYAPTAIEKAGKVTEMRGPSGWEKQMVEGILHAVDVELKISQGKREPLIFFMGQAHVPNVIDKIEEINLLK